MNVGKMHLIQDREGKPIREVLIEIYPLYRNQSEVAKALGISQPTLSQWIQRLGLQEKTILVPRQEVTQDARHP